MKIFKMGLIVFILLLFSWSNAYAIAREIAIISHKEYPADAITKTKIKDIYLGEKLHEDGIKIRPMDHKDESIKKSFIEKVIGRSSDGYKAYWIKKFFQEGIKPPIVKTSSSEVIQTVSQTSGGIGYVWGDEVKGDVKVLLKIDVGN